MIRILSLCVLMGIPVVCLRGFTADSDPGGFVKPAERMAVVNVMRVFQAYKKVAAIKRDLKKEFEPSRKALESRERALRDVEMRLAYDTQGQAQRARLQEVLQFKMKKFDFEEDSKKFYEQVESKRMGEMKQVLREIQDAIRSIAQRRRIDLVLRAPDHEDDGRVRDEMEDGKKSPTLTAAALVMKFSRNAVLFHAPQIDLTAEVIKTLNNRYVLAQRADTDPDARATNP